MNTGGRLVFGLSFKIILFPFHFILDKIFDQHDRFLEKKIRREIEVTLSHELRTPLTSIYAYSEMLLDKLRDTEDKEYALIINKKSKDLIRYIDNTIFLSILDFNPGFLNKTEVNISEILIESLGDFKKNYISDKIFFINSEIEPGIYFNANERLLKKLFLELFINAYLYSKDNVELIIHTKLKKKDKDIYILIKDNGMGIKEKHIERVFEKYYRVEDIYTAKTHGLGIGLTLVKKITDIYNGRISISSKYNLGTTMEIALPVN